jgi:hypothetical protein
MHPLFRPDKLRILAVNLLIVAFFSAVFWAERPTKLIGYVALIVVVGAFLGITYPKQRYPNSLLWGVTLWSALHFVGGSVFFQSKATYDVVLIPLTENMLRYDQLVHVFGFGLATLFVFHILQSALAKPITNWFAIGVAVVMAGLGIGAINEMVEFVFLPWMPTAGNDYSNALLDLFADVIGALIAFGVIYGQEKGKS